MIRSMEVEVRSPIVVVVVVRFACNLDEMGCQADIQTVIRTRE